MNEETEEQHSEEDQASPVGLDDKRFEVKWRKKESSSGSQKGSEDDRPVQAGTPGDEGAEPEAGDLQRELGQAREQIDTLRDRWQRAAADLANFRRRSEEEKGEVEKFANMLLVAELLPVLDNFERAIATIPGNLAMLTWIHGVILIERQLRATLERQGLTEVETQGKQFNPALHEAIDEKESAEVPAGSIVQVYQKGYELGGRLIRPALVQIAKAPSESTARPQEKPGAETAEEAETENVGP